MFLPSCGCDRPRASLNGIEQNGVSGIAAIVKTGGDFTFLLRRRGWLMAETDWYWASQSVISVGEISATTTSATSSANISRNKDPNEKRKTAQERQEQALQRRQLSNFQREAFTDESASKSMIFPGRSSRRRTTITYNRIEVNDLNAHSTLGASAAAAATILQILSLVAQDKQHLHKSRRSTTACWKKPSNNDFRYTSIASNLITIYLVFVRVL